MKPSLLSYYLTIPLYEHLQIPGGLSCNSEGSPWRCRDLRSKLPVVAGKGLACGKWTIFSSMIYL